MPGEGGVSLNEEGGVTLEDEGGVTWGGDGSGPPATDDSTVFGTTGMMANCKGWIPRYVHKRHKKLG